MIGYYLMFALRHYQVKQVIALQIEKEVIDSDQMLVFKIPINLPYLTDWEDYEKVSGSFHYEGRFFEKVKQILRRDTMIVYCVENQNQKKLFDELEQHTRTQLPDLDQSTSQNSSKKISIVFIKEYLPFAEYYFTSIQNASEINFLSHYSCYEPQINLNILVPPPQVV